eukprot:3593139-Alexandrium_andersonii.AAC.1
MFSVEKLLAKYGAHLEHREAWVRTGEALVAVKRACDLDPQRFDRAVHSQETGGKMVCACVCLGLKATTSTRNVP